MNDDCDPVEPCPDCGNDMPRGLDRCSACEAKKAEYEVSADDPRRL